MYSNVTFCLVYIGEPVILTVLSETFWRLIVVGGEEDERDGSGEESK